MPQSQMFSWAGVLLLAGLAPAFAQAAETQVKVTTVTYKTVGELQIDADVYRPDDEVARPIVVSIHGGALMMGNRKGVHNKLRHLCQQEGFAIVSIDYRLAPETKLPAIIEDVQDAFRWLHGDGARQFHLDTKKVVVVGASAGGYLALMTGICVEPRPSAIVSYWGFGDVDGSWQTTPSEHYRKGGLISDADARNVVGDTPLTGGEPAASELGRKDRSKFFVYCRQNGVWPREIMDLDPATDRDKFTPFCPIRNLSADYPPTLMIHGTADTDVPSDKSVEMAEALAKRGLPHELILIPNGGHGLGGGDPKLIEAAHARALAFIAEHLK